MSLPTQVNACKRLAISQHLPVEDEFVFIEMHTGEELYERPELTKLRDLAKQRQFAMVFVNSIDRLSRDPIHLGIILEELSRHGVQVQFVAEDLENSPEAQLIRFIRGYAGKVENERRRERFMRSSREKVARGIPLGNGRATYGYVWSSDKHHLIPEPTASRIVILIFVRVAKGITLRGVAKELTDAGIPTPTGRIGWNANTIRCIVTNPVYWGSPMAFRHRMVPVDKAVRHLYSHKSRQVAVPEEDWVALPSMVAPALVEPALAAQIKERLRLNKLRAPRNAKYPDRALLRGGFLYCYKCGHVMATNTSRDRKDATELRTRYFCRGNGFLGESRCRATSIEAHLIDTMAWAKVLDLVRNSDVVVQELAHMKAMQAPGHDTVQAIQKQIDDADRRIGSLVRLAAEMGQDEIEAISDQLRLLKGQRTRLEREMVAAQQHYASWERQREELKEVDRWLKNVEHNIGQADYMQKRQILNALRAKVTLYPPDQVPRAKMTVTFPASGVKEIPLDNENSDYTSLGMCTQFTRTYDLVTAV